MNIDNTDLFEQMQAHAKELLHKVEETKFVPNDYERNAGSTTVIQEYLDGCNYFEQDSLVQFQAGGNLITFDYQVIQNATAYSFGPVCMYDGVPRSMVTLSFPNMRELRNALHDKKYILYFTALNLKTQEVDKELFTVTKLEFPTATFLFRGVILD
jgi:hypothetical protein